MEPHMNADGISHTDTEDTEKREEESGCTAKVAKGAERRASHESTRIGTNADHTQDAWNRGPGTKSTEPQMDTDEHGWA